MRVAIVALGPSGLQWVRLAEGLGDWRHQFDEVWAVNGFANVLQCTRGFAMDDVRVQEIRAKAGNKKIEQLLESYKRHPGPIYTSRIHPDYPALVEYPLEAVVNACVRDYFNSTVAYPIALAIYERATSIAMFGADYSFPDKHVAEEGRACCEYWLGVADARGIRVGIASGSSMLDACKPKSLYGYDGFDASWKIDANGYKHLTLADKPLPTAQEIEASYDKQDHLKKEAA